MDNHSGWLWNVVLDKKIEIRKKAILILELISPTNMYIIQKTKFASLFHQNFGEIPQFGSTCSKFCRN